MINPEQLKQMAVDVSKKLGVDAAVIIKEPDEMGNLLACGMSQSKAIDKDIEKNTGILKSCLCKDNIYYIQHVILHEFSHIIVNTLHSKDCAHNLEFKKKEEETHKAYGLVPVYASALHDYCSTLKDLSDNVLWAACKIIKTNDVLEVSTECSLWKKQ